MTVKMCTVSNFLCNWHVCCLFVFYLYFGKTEFFVLFKCQVVIRHSGNTKTSLEVTYEKELTRHTSTKYPGHTAVSAM
jgi:hypothetical protein